MSEYAFEGVKRSSTTIAWSFAAETLTNDARTPFSSFVDPAYQATVQAAFARWASVSGLTFTQVADSPAVPIRVGFEAFGRAGQVGETDFRSMHGLLSTGTLVRLLDPAAVELTLDASGRYYYPGDGVTLLQVALHEIGHALGLDHTTDPTTIMFPYATVANRDLAPGDIQGINTLYPYFTVVAALPVRVAGATGEADRYGFTVTRYSDPAVALTIGYAVSGTPYPTVPGSVAAAASEFVGGAYPSGQLTFAAGSATATLSVEVVGARPAMPAAGFSLALSSLDASDSVTVRGQVAAAILDDGFAQVSSTSIGIYRFFDRAYGTHFYSASAAERNTLVQSRPDLIYEGATLRAVASPSADEAAAPVYRFFDLTHGTHFYSISPAERDTLLATRSDLAFEGTAFYEHDAAQMGDMPVYRFFDVVDGTHFYTASASERASILMTRSDLHDEGVGFYAPAA